MISCQMCRARPCSRLNGSGTRNYEICALAPGSNLLLYRRHTSKTDVSVFITSLTFRSQLPDDKSIASDMMTMIVWITTITVTAPLRKPVNWDIFRTASIVSSVCSGYGQPIVIALRVYDAIIPEGFVVQ